MPVIIGPASPTTPTSPPVVSSDGILTAQVTDKYGAVLLKVTPGAAFGTLPYVSVTRTQNGVTSTVRGMDAVRAPNGAIAGIDGELTLGVAATYRAVTAAGAQSTAVAVQVARPVARQWLKHPTNVGLSMAVSIDEQPNWQSSRPQSVLRVVGRRNPIVVSGTRGASDASTRVHLFDADSQSRFGALLDAGGPLLLQADAANSNRRDRWVTISQDTFQQIYDPTYRKVPIDLTEVDRPDTAGSSVAIPGRRYADLTGAWSAQSGPYLTLGA